MNKIWLPLLNFVTKLLNINLSRLYAMMKKEFIQMRRDPATLGMIIGIPLIQVVLFGFAINNDPKQLATALIDEDRSEWSRTFLYGVQNTNYFAVNKLVRSEKEADELMAEGKVQFIIHIPAGFTRSLLRSESPALLLEADATDPVATGNAVSAVRGLAQTIFKALSQGANQHHAPPPPLFDVRIHSRYNPAGITQYNIVPGLLGVVITMTMTMITSMAVTRERERGTMEHLLATPIKPLEVMIGKVTPYIIVGYIQIVLILVAAFLFFHVPIRGNLFLLMLASFPFIVANLSVGLSLSTLAQNQLQAVHMSTFFFLPSILLSGFMFPFYGMPMWARVIGEILPLTHFLRICRGILLKANGWFEVWPNVWPILIFLVIALAMGVKQYRQTLD